MMTYARSAALNCAMLLGVVNSVLLPMALKSRKYASQPIPSTVTSYASPSPELYKEQTASGSSFSRDDNQSESPGTVLEIGSSESVACSNKVQSACGRLYQGHQTVNPVPISEAAAPAHAANTDPSIDSSPNRSARTSQMRDDTDFRRKPGGTPNAARHPSISGPDGGGTVRTDRATSR